MEKAILIVICSMLFQPVFASSNHPVHVGVQVERVDVPETRQIKPLKERSVPKPMQPKVVARTPTRTQIRSSGSQSTNEKLAWNYLIARYSRNQTAGIMGNLRQEHNFQTSGDGIAQWMGGRKARLMAMKDPYNINTQLNFLVIEMKEMGLVLPNTVEGATRVFQDKFERCGVCMESQRIRYAYDILSRY